jgi:hypothetical protein
MKNKRNNIEDEIKSYGYNLVTIWEMDWEILRKERGLKAPFIFL